jgi:hypothetical protein
MKFSKLNLKTIVLVALFVFYLVILLSNLFVREGLENNETPDKKEEEEESDETTATPTAEPSEESLSSEPKPAGTTKPKNKETTKPKK